MPQITRGPLRGGIFLFLLSAGSVPVTGGAPETTSLASATAFTFTDVSTTANIDFQHSGIVAQDRWIGTGAAWFDFDRDGDLDLYVTRRTGANALYENDGGTFTDVASAMGVANPAGDGAGVAVADFNNDGWPDFYLVNARGGILYRNDGGLSFTNITASPLPDVTYSRGTSASWGDYDGDGFLDLYVTQHQHIDGFANSQDHLYHNNGDETFDDVSVLLNADTLMGAGFIGAWTDFDNDGDCDIFLINDCPLGPLGTQLLRNDGGTHYLDWTFTNVSASMNVEACRAGMGIAIGDYNRDGWLDYFYTNIGAPMLLENRQTIFYDATRDAGVNHAFTPGGLRRVSWGANFFDFDLDGWQDLFVTSGAMRAGSQPNLLYRNSGDGITFLNATGGSGVNDTLLTRTSVFGDYDDDGDPDLFVVNYEGPARLFRNNNANGNHYLIIDLEGVRCNRDGIGSRLRITTPDGERQHYEIHSGSSLGGGDDIAAYFGLGTHTTVSELLVRWPSGLVQAVHDVPADQRLKVTEDANARATRIRAVNGVSKAGGITISWKTAFEIDNDGFEIQHKRGGAFETIDHVAGGGGMFDAAEYSYEVTNLPPGTHEFRLRQMNHDGSVELSSEIVVGLHTPGAPLISVAYPNPFRSQTILTLAVERDQVARVDVYNVKGQLVTVLFEGTVRALAPEALLFDATGRPAGIYFVRAQGETFSFSQKIVLVK